MKNKGCLLRYERCAMLPSTCVYLFHALRTITCAGRSPIGSRSHRWASGSRGLISSLVLSNSSGSLECPLLEATGIPPARSRIYQHARPGGQASVTGAAGHFQLMHTHQHASTYRCATDSCVCWRAYNLMQEKDGRGQCGTYAGVAGRRRRGCCRTAAATELACSCGAGSEQNGGRVCLDLAGRCTVLQGRGTQANVDHSGG